jgi:hypothetical protein
MKSMQLLLVLMAVLALSAAAQNVNNQYFFKPRENGKFAPASFVIDTVLPTTMPTRAMLVWGKSYPNASGFDDIAYDLSAIDQTGTVVDNASSIQAPGNLVGKELYPKKIIRSAYGKFYYLLAFTPYPAATLNGVGVVSVAHVFKLNDTLKPVWYYRMHLAGLGRDITLDSAHIEFNDILETADQQVVLVGQFAQNASSKRQVQAVKLNAANGKPIWSYRYAMDNCNAHANSVEEASNGELVLTGQVEDCAVGGTYVPHLLFGRINSLGEPIEFKKLDYSGGRTVMGDKISRFISSPGADRFFITGYLNAGALGTENHENMVLDIGQQGAVNKVAFFGGAGVENINDHIFRQIPHQANQYELNFVGYTHSYDNIGKGYYGTIKYNAATRSLSLPRYEVMKNELGPYIYKDRKAIEIKYAGPNRFAILFHSFGGNIAEPADFYGDLANVYVRDFLSDAQSATTNEAPCFDAQKPILKTTDLNARPIERVVYKALLYEGFPEDWVQDSLLGKETDCGTGFKVFPKQAVLATVRHSQYNGPGDTMLRRRAIVADNQRLVGDATLYPNPANDAVYLSPGKSFGTAKGPVTAQLYTPEMKWIASYRLQGQTVHRLPTDRLKPGLYLLQLQTNERQQLLRFVKQ